MRRSTLKPLNIQHGVDDIPVEKMCLNKKLRNAFLAVGRSHSPPLQANPPPPPPPRKTKPSLARLGTRAGSTNREPSGTLSETKTFRKKATGTIGAKVLLGGHRPVG